MAKTVEAPPTKLVPQDQRTTDDLIQKPSKTELHDSQVRAFARTRGLELPAKGRLSKERTAAIKQAFADEWTAATGTFDRRIARLQGEWDKATGHLTPYLEDGSPALPAEKQPE